jgi:TonB family protein
MLTAIAWVGSARLAASIGSGDAPLRITQPFAATFPPVLLAEGITSGQVRAVIHIDAEGKLADFLVVAYTHRELATELAGNLREWQFEPARDRGEAAGTRTEIVFNFEAKGAVLSLTAVNSANALNRWIPAEVVSLVCHLGELDQPLVAIQTVRPVHPGPRLQPARPTGSAVIDFYVDAEGRPRMPVVARATHEAFGARAVDALARWRFSSPSRGGKPVAVRVRQTFLFTDRSEEIPGTG